MNTDEGVLALNTEMHDIIEEDTEEVMEDEDEWDNQIVVMEVDRKEPEVAKVQSEVAKVTKEKEKTSVIIKGQGKPPFKYELDQTKTNIFYSDIPMPKEYLKDVPTQFVYKLMTGTLEETIEEIKADIKDVKPKYLILHCFGKHVAQRSNDNLTIINAVYELVDLVDEEKIHQIAVSTCHFIPNKPQTWDDIANFNCQMRIVNIDRDLPPLTLHKCLMDREFETYGPLIIKGCMWLEYVQQEGLGETLSRSGLGKYKHFILKAFQHQFVVKERNPSVRNIGTPKPPPLAATKGYEDYPFMFNILKERNLTNLKGVYNRRPSTPFIPIDPPKIQPQAVQAAEQPQTLPKEQSPPRSSSATNIPTSGERSPSPIRPRSWYAHNIQVSESEGGARRKTTLPSTSNDSGIFSGRKYNEDQLSYQELEEAFDRLESRSKKDERYYKTKIDDLYLEIEDLKDDKTKMKQDKDYLKKEVNDFVDEVKKLTLEIETLRLAEDCYKDKLKSVERKMTDKDDQIKLKDEAFAMLERQYQFVKDLHNDVGEYLYDKQEKHDKKKKRASR